MFSFSPFFSPSVTSDDMISGKLFLFLFYDTTRPPDVGWRASGRVLPAHPPLPLETDNKKSFCVFSGSAAFTVFFFLVFFFLVFFFLVFFFLRSRWHPTFTEYIICFFAMGVIFACCLICCSIFLVCWDSKMMCVLLYISYSVGFYPQVYGCWCWMACCGLSDWLSGYQ